MTTSGFDVFYSAKKYQLLTQKTIQIQGTERKITEQAENSSVHGILQARTLEWVDIPFSRGSSQPRDQT